MNETKPKKTATKRKAFKVLVTGGAGFLGHHIIEKLQNEGCDIVAIVRPSTDLSRLQDKKVKFVPGDIRDQEVLAEAMQGVDVVVHAAATMWGSWEDFQAINVESTRRLLELAHENGVKRFVHISSVSVYDHSRAESGHVFTEDAPFQTEQLIFYSQSKIEAEKVVWDYHEKHKLPVVVLRPAALYGPGGSIYPAQLGIQAGDNRFIVFGRGTSDTLLCHVRSVAEAVWLGMTKKEAVGRSYNVSEDEQLSRVDYLKKVKQFGNSRLSIIKLPLPIAFGMSYSFRALFKLLGRKAPLRPLFIKTSSRSFYYSNERLKKELGWKPAVDVQQSLLEVLGQFRKSRVPKRNMAIEKGRVSIPTNASVNVGIVGCGEIANVHLSILKDIPNANLVALADPVATTRDEMASKFGVSRTYDALKDMLANEKIDVVHICAPAQFHADLAVQAMQAGCHVLVEKPMALTTRDAEKMVQVAEQKKVKLCVGHNHLYDAPMIRAREIIASGALGRVAQVESWYGVSLSSDGGNRALAYESRNGWFYRMPGELYQDFISHPISLLTDVMGEVQAAKSVAKYFRVVPFMKSDELRVLVENDQMMGSLVVSLAASPRYQFLKIYGTQGTLTVDILNKYVFVDKVPGAVPKTIARNLSNFKLGIRLIGRAFGNLMAFVFGKLSLFEGTERMIRLFYRSVLLNEPVPVSAQEGLQSMRLMDEIWSQIRERNGRSGMARKKERAVVEGA